MSKRLQTKNNDHRVLCIPHNPASFSEMLEIADPLRKTGKYHPLFIFEGAGYSDAVEICHQLGIEYRTIGRIGAKDASKSDTGERQLKRQRVIIEWLKRRFLVQLVMFIVQYGIEKRRAKRLLVETCPQAILLIGDRHAGIETSIVQQANRYGIPSLIIPYALSDLDGGVLLRMAVPDWKRKYGMKSWFNRTIARLYPEWSHLSKEQTLLWQPPAALLAAAFWGIMPAKPWIIGGGGSWAMTVESEHSKGGFLSQGMSGEKILVTGKPRYDRAAKVWQDRVGTRKHLCAELGLKAGKKLLVCAVPQFGEHELLPWDQHWIEVEFLFSVFSELLQITNVILSLHPKSDYAQYAPLADKYGLTIANQKYDQLIPISDIFVATYSSTVTLAIAAHIPVVIFDFLAFNSPYFNQVSGVEVIYQREQFLPKLQQILGDKDYYNQLVEGQRQAAKTWARFDGKSTERILDLIDDLVEQGREIRKLPRRERRKALPAWSQ